MVSKLMGRHLDLEERFEQRLPPRLQQAWARLDGLVAGFMRSHGTTLLRLAIAVVFVWFGGLKLAGRSPVADLVADTVPWLPADFFVRFLGVWEVAIGLGLLLPVALRLTLLLFFLQMAGTFLVLVIQPGEAFQSGNPLLLTVSGEFVIKNLVLITAGLVVGSTVRRDSRQRQPL